MKANTSRKIRPLRLFFRSAAAGFYNKAGKKIVKVWSVVVAVAAVEAGVVVAARVEVAAMVVVTMALVLVSPPTVYKSFAIVLFHLKLISSENKKTLKNS